MAMQNEARDKCEGSEISLRRERTNLVVILLEGLVV